MLKTLASLALAAAAAVALAASAGAQAPDTPKKASKQYTIAVIPKGTTHEFWKSIHAGASKAAEELGVSVLWRGPLKEDNREEQIKVVEDMINRGVNGIVLAPLDDTALRAPVASATRAGIPVVIIDSDLKSKDYASFVATDNKKGGNLGGQELVRLIRAAGARSPKVVMLRYQEGSASTMNREQGFLDAIKDANEIQRERSPKIDVVSSNQYGGATTETAYKAAENLLAQYKNADGTLSIDGIFTPNESTTFGMLRALQDAKLAGKVKFVGFDASAKLVQGLEKDEINALVLQNPINMGYLGVKTMVQHLEGQKVEKRIDTGVQLVTKANMNEPKVKEILNPDLSKLKD